MISVVIPAYNEEKIIAQTAKTLEDTLRRDFGEDFELILVSDGSTDRTAEIIESLVSDRIRSCGYEKNRGKGGAVKEGILNSLGDIVLYTDCDLAYGADIIKTFAESFTDPSVDASIGSRRLDPEGYKEYTFLRKLMSGTYLMILKLFAGFSYSDSQCGIKAFRGEYARKIFTTLETPGFAFDLEALLLADKMKLKIKEIPVKIINHRESKVSPVRDTLRMLRDLRKIKKRLK
ncbi:MAG: glycosyltransferase [Ruminococcaceae bacterium]|nr:glycosyltransferase [Oscillospiraceae bacterium]